MNQHLEDKHTSTKSQPWLTMPTQHVQNRGCMWSMFARFHTWTVRTSFRTESGADRREHRARRIFDQLYKQDLIIRAMSCDSDQKPQIKSLALKKNVLTKHVYVRRAVRVRREHVLVILCSAAGWRIKEAFDYTSGSVSPGSRDPLRAGLLLVLWGQSVWGVRL